jgi:hypothetical protein
MAAQQQHAACLTINMAPQGIDSLRGMDQADPDQRSFHRIPCDISMFVARRRLFHRRLNVAMLQRQKRIRRHEVRVACRTSSRPTGYSTFDLG